MVRREDFLSFAKIKVVIMLSFIFVLQSLLNIKTLICCSVLQNGSCPWVRLMPDGGLIVVIIVIVVLIVIVVIVIVVVIVYVIVVIVFVVIVFQFCKMAGRPWVRLMPAV